MFFELESPELLSMILKKIPGLSKFKLVDARFLWTEPHSRRIKVRVVVQAEALEKVQVQQKVDIEFVVHSRQCMDCIRESTAHTWRSLVQVRQRINTKRTMFFLEQKIIASGMQEHIIDTEPAPEGLDLYFAEKSHAQHFVQFIQSHFPTKITTSKKLVSADWKSNIMNFQYTSVVEIVPLARTDLVIVPKAVAPGKRQTLLLVSKLSSVVHLMDPLTLEHFELTSNRFWRQPFSPLVIAQQAVNFIVLCVDLVGRPGQETAKNADGLLAEVEIAKESDFGVNDRTYRVTTHLGHVLHEGDTVLGYDLATLALDESLLEGLNYDPPDVVLIKKVYPAKDKAGKKKLRSLRGRRRRKNPETGSIISDTLTDAGDADYQDFATMYDEDDLQANGAASELPAIDEQDETIDEDAAPESGELPGEPAAVRHLAEAVEQLAT